MLAQRIGPLTVCCAVSYFCNVTQNYVNTQLQQNQNAQGFIPISQVQCEVPLLLQ